MLAGTHAPTAHHVQHRFENICPLRTLLTDDSRLYLRKGTRLRFWNVSAKSNMGLSASRSYCPVTARQVKRSAYRSQYDNDKALEFADVEQFMASKGINVVKEDSVGCVNIKCIVFEEKGRSRVIVAVVNQDSRVDLVKLAHALGIKRHDIVMVPGDMLVSRIGYRRGEVPPFGFLHHNQITRVVDENLLSVADANGHLENIVRFGPIDAEVCIRAQDLLVGSEVTQVANISEDIPKPGSPLSYHDGQRDILAPLPEESRDTTLLVLVVRKRKLAKRLVFATVVPSAGDRVLSNAYAIRGRKHKKSLLWKHPVSGEPCELQCIFGKSLEKRYGKSVMEGMLKRIVKGGYIRVSGRIQDNKNLIRHNNTNGGSVDFIVHDMEQVSMSAAPSQDSEGMSARWKGELGSRVEMQQYPFRNLSKFKKNKNQANQNILPEYISPITDIFLVRTLDELSSMVQYFSDALGMQGAERLWSNEKLDTAPALSGINASKYKYRDGWQPRMVVSLDAEWRPTVRQGANNPVSILQIGTHDRAFLIDMLHICLYDRNERITEEQMILSNFIDYMFSHPEIAKLGFGLRYDIKRLCESYSWMPCFSNPESLILSHIDVLMLSRISSSSRDGSSSLSARVGLNTLVSKVLGKSLDKEEQISDWGARPLTAGQIQYAVADVSCLIDIYKRILKESPEILNSKTMAQCAMNLYHMGGSPLASQRQTIEMNMMHNMQSPQRKRHISEATCDTKSLIPFLGEYIPTGGKLGVVKACLGNGEAEKSTALYKIPRGGAIIEMSNAFLIFINVPSKVYPNTFESCSNGKVRMSWWTSPGQTRSHPVIIRLLSGEKSLHLFCRREKDKYIYFGNLQIDEECIEEEENGQMKLYFTLMDYTELLASSLLVAKVISVHDAESTLATATKNSVT